jgi:diguanylate cyclase (GGDEF)-like protein
MLDSRGRVALARRNMMRDLQGAPGDPAASALAAAYTALDRGQVQHARELAHAVLIDVQGVDLHLEARVLACLAHCDRLGSKLRRASEASRRAAQIFEQLGDVNGEAGALTTLAHVSMLLGRNDAAVEASLLCVRLCAAQAPQPQAVLANNALGLAYSWSGDHDRADASLEQAVAVARGCAPPVSIYQPRLNQIWVEASRLLDERYQTGRMHSLARLTRLVAECDELERAGQAVSVLPGLQFMRLTIAHASNGLLLVWKGDPAAARVALAHARAALSPEPTWLDAFAHWLAAEIAWAEHDFAQAEALLIEMRDLALAVEHEQFACRAHLLLSQLFEVQGKEAAARREHRALRQRERRVVAESLASREAVVAWQLGARQIERHLQQALVASKQFERWSLEDALTGIANRRHFEHELNARLRSAAARDAAVSVAMVDVDKFKSVNDRFTHRVGDRVLKTVAALMASQMRGGDLPARWAGDEFVILFGDTTEAMAEQLGERLRLSVAAFDWESIAPGLRVTISVGLSQARPGDTAESVLHRSDESMYLTKPVGPDAMPPRAGPGPKLPFEDRSGPQDRRQPVDRTGTVTPQRQPPPAQLRGE